MRSLELRIAEVCVKRDNPGFASLSVPAPNVRMVEVYQTHKVQKHDAGDQDKDDREYHLHRLWYGKVGRDQPPYEPEDRQDNSDLNESKDHEAPPLGDIAF